MQVMINHERGLKSILDFLHVASSAVTMWSHWLQEQSCRVKAILLNQNFCFTKEANGNSINYFFYVLLFPEVIKVWMKLMNISKYITIFGTFWCFQTPVNSEASVWDLWPWQKYKSLMDTKPNAKILLSITSMSKFTLHFNCSTNKGLKASGCYNQH